MQERSRQSHESSLGCGILSHERVAPTLVDQGLRKKWARFGMLFLTGALGLAGGCSDDASPGAAGGSGGSGGSTGGSGGAGGMCNATSTACVCQTDPMDTYVANMAKVGLNQKLTFQLIQSNPAPPIKGSNDWKVKITDMAGAAVSTGLTIRVWMPKHGHDSPTPTKITYDAASSTFDLNPIGLSLMPGIWRVSMTVKDASNVLADQADFDFCVD